MHLFKSAGRRHLILTLAAAITLLPASGRSASADSPNVLLIMVDDLGWMDLACQGNDRLTTPNIDRLARQGMRFTDAYAAAPVCSPTRAAVMTGLSPARLRITNHIPDQPRFTPPDATLASAEMLDHLPTSHVTLAELLKTRRYTNGFFGKWHLAGAAQPRSGGQGDLRYYPEQQGFDLNIGGCAMGGPFSFFDPYQLHNFPDRKAGEYMPDRLADEVISFITRHRDGPFFACLWNYTVHWPMEAPESLIAKYRENKNLGRVDPRYAAMIEALDGSIGRILDHLDQLQLADHTLVIFTSDNGAFGGVADLAPLRAAKGFLYEGGIRVPLIIRYPGLVPAGSVSNEPVISMDFLPTIAELADVTLPNDIPWDGTSLVPLLDGQGKLARDAIYFHYPNYAFHRDNRLGSAIRSGSYKLIENFDDGSVELYNLAEDIGEKQNLAETEPERARQLRDQLAAWRKSSHAAMPRPRTGS